MSSFANHFSDFPSHGHYIIRVIDHVLFIDATGPYNREAADRLYDVVRQTVTAEMMAHEWALLVRLHGESIYTEESVPILTELHNWRVTHGMRHLAVVYSDDHPETNGLMSFQFSTVYEAEVTEHCQIQYFFTISEALGWLRPAGYISENTSDELFLGI